MNEHETIINIGDAINKGLKDGIRFQKFVQTDGRLTFDFKNNCCPTGMTGRKRYYMKKLNDIINTYNVTAYEFPAFKGLERLSNQDGYSATVSTLSAAVMADMGIDTYYSPVIPRGTVFNTVDEVIAAGLDVNEVCVAHVDNVPANAPVIIASRHPGTVAMLQEMYPNNTVFASVAPEDIWNKDVVGTLPPHLIQYANSFRAVAIKDFDYTKDGHLEGEELRRRMIFTGTVRVTIG